MEFLQDNWFWLVLVALFVGMHSFGMGCCGRRHGRTEGDGGKNKETEGEESGH